jgi:hypothetical protein
MRKLLATTACALLMSSALAAFIDGPALACGSSWAICKYRNHWRNNGGFRGPAYEKAQRQIRTNCNPATVWKDACR